MSNTTDTTKRTMEDYFNEFLLTILNSTNGALVNELKLRWKEYCNTPLVTLNTNDTGKEETGGLKTGIMSQMDMYNMGYKDGVKYAQFIKPEQPTNDNAFVEDQLTAFVNSLRGVKWDNDFFVHFVWGITPVVGRITLLPYTKQLQIMPCKNTDDIGSGNGQSVIINFPRNDLKQSKQSAPEPSALPTKEWEIVDMKHYEDNSIHPYLKKTCFNPSHPPCTIWSVRRLSDNVVFSVGDSICLSWYPAFDVVQPIKKINIDGGKVYLYYNDSSCYELHNARLNPKHTPPQPSTVKDKEALFTTEDGVKIYDYSKSLFAIVKKDKSFYIHENFIGANPSEHYYFSTKEAAEQYIIENKPCLSVLELFSCYDGTHYKQPILRDSSLYIKLIEKVKQKLKQ